ncbi:Outer spore wall assembly protein SHE10 [Candida viswanathii]|uniref:Outer spore wall assembly protein SHE10 n=1 Tax=Candida viswanathii TaxID=5486 RepID=A0A367Y994_9ASCO|nr:Outer spore wall assembly protein SHE10 [Candida viswanathii]
MAYGSKFIGGVITLYLFYVWTFICPLTTIDNETNSLSPINHHFCSISNSYIKPRFQPIYEQHVTPLLNSVDEKLGVGAKYEQGVALAHKLDDKFEISSAVGRFSESACDYLQKLIDQFQDKIAPQLVRVLKLTILRIRVYWELFKINLQFYSTPLVNQLNKLGRSIRSIEVVGKVIDFVNDIFVKLAISKHALKLQEKSKFVQQEFKNLVNIDDFSANDIKNNVMQVVKDILGENVFEKEKIDEAAEAAEGVAEHDEDAYDDEQYDDEEPETVIITSTIVVTEGSNAVSTDDPVWGPILHEIDYWENKVNKSISLAMNNLQVDMKPKIDSVVQEIKPEISLIMQDLQKINGEQYAKMNRKIAAIEKDFQEMKQTNDTSIETVGRQEIRDDIAECSATAQDGSKKIQEILTNAHENVLVAYFRSLQDTIDILETTSETTINNFQNQLNSLITQLELEDEDEISWKIWKKFHKIKESLFDFRDFLFDSANDYKADNKGKSVIGLEEWNKYLQNIEAHLNFLMRDNIEYLQIVRARANIAFQMREGLVYDLNKAYEEKEKEEQAKEEPVEEPVEVPVGEPVQQPFKVAEEDQVVEEPIEEAENDTVEDELLEDVSIEDDVEIEYDLEDTEPIAEEVEDSNPIDDESSSETPIESAATKSETTPDFESSSTQVESLDKSDEADHEEPVESAIEVEEVYEEVILEKEPIEEQDQKQGDESKDNDKDKI